MTSRGSASAGRQDCDKVITPCFCDPLLPSKVLPNNCFILFTILWIRKGFQKTLIGAFNSDPGGIRCGSWDWGLRIQAGSSTPMSPCHCPIAPWGSCPSICQSLSPRTHPFPSNSILPPLTILSSRASAGLRIVFFRGSWVARGSKLS